MPDTRVMVVDDSAAMRALFCDILDNADGVAVCGTASNADEARDKLDEFKPDVLTLDVEMPGKSGMDFLAELMEERPMPVIMLSSITQAGTGTAKRALELGAVHCFPKPLHSSREEFDATVKKLGGIVLKAASGELKSGGEGEEGGVAYEPGDKLLAVACGQAGIDAAKRLLAAYPANCPPTILVLDAEPDVVERELISMAGSLACGVEKAVDGLSLTPGRAYIAFEKSHHVIVEGGHPPRLRMIARDPVAGSRPSADLLMGSIARASVPAIGGLLVGAGRDGAKGLQIFAGAGYEAFVQPPADYAPRDRYEAVRALGLEAEELKADTLGAWVLEKTAA
ncbi:MAG: chemotaxis protein CheB [Erythrobacter sp.]|nr:chemotaxis protein CheB [Erythrobacter sp.]